MYPEITQGDSGVIIDLFLSDNDNKINVTNATVKATIRYKSYSVEKECIVVDAINGHCQLILDSTNTVYIGLYTFQISITYQDGRKFSSNRVYRYNVNKNIGMGNPFPPPPVTGGGNVSISDSTTNGNIVVNSVEIQVFNDSNIMSEITTLKNSDAFKRIGISTNGKLTIDGVEQSLEDPTSPIDGGTFTTTYNTTIVDGGEF